MRRARWALLALLGSVPLAPELLTPAPLAGQTPDRVAAARAQLSAEVAVALSDLAAQAERRGLPTDPLVDKALEGTAKRVPDALIVQALRGLVADLGRAQALLQGSAAAHAAHLEAVALAVRRGAPPDAVRRLALGAPADEPFGVTVNTLADLTARGVEGRGAVALLLTWRGQGGRLATLTQIPAALDRLLREGVLPAQAAGAIDAALRGTGPPLGLTLPPAAKGPP